MKRSRWADDRGASIAAPFENRWLAPRVAARSLILCWLISLGIDSRVSFSAPPWPQPVGRQTDDRDADLIDALIRAGRHDDALSICESRLRRADPESDATAKWSIRQSKILVSRQMEQDQFDDADVQMAQQPAAKLLAAYPNHRRRLFLQAQQIAVRRQAAFHSVLRAAVAPSSAAAREVATTRLLRAKTAIESLADRVGDAQSEVASQGDEGRAGMVEDLGQLQQELRVDAVSLALMQTELFTRGSVDCIAAATKAEQAADEAIARLPADTPARLEVERLKVEAIFRGEQAGRAAAGLDALTRAFGQPTPPRVQAMHVRQDIAARRMAQAGARLVAFYGQSPQGAAPSIEMDLARLEFLLHSGQGVGNWLDAIEKRGGGYARRRAEAISLASLRRRRGSAPDSVSTTPMVDPSLVAAQGQDWLRRGDPGRGGELLSAAAAAEPNSDRAIQRASEAAAALVAAGRTNDAAQVLADISLAKPSGAKAAATHLQAMLMVASSIGENVGQRLEAMLRANLKQWPSGETAAAVRQWLQKLLQEQNRDVEAAEVATDIDVAEISKEDVVMMFDLWRTAFRSQPDASLSELSKRFQASLNPLLESPLVQPSYRLAAAMLLDRENLSQLPGGGGDDPATRFADALVDFRQRGVVSQPLRSPPQEYLEDMTWRLMRDGRSHPERRESIAELIAQWNVSSDASLEQAERLMWSGSSDAAVAMIRTLIEKSPGSAETIQQAAELLASSNDPPALAEAIKLWDELAAGSKLGSHRWHEAKLAAIELLQRAGKRVEAQRRAKYVLLTAPGIDQALQRRYQSASQ